MDTNELNVYIKNYLENDKTQRAIMLTAPWGSGKSYYIKHSLCPFLIDNKLDYAVVSLYGLKEIKDLNKELYLEIKFKKSNKRKAKALASAFGKTMISGAAGIGKTILKHIANVDIDFNLKEPNYDKLYESVNLKNKLIIFEDLERTSIDIIEFLGYVNNITENDGAKVLLVANEQEIVKVRYKKDEFTNKEVPEYTEYAERYLKIREKTISDTIKFYSDYHSTIKSIIERFSNKYFEKMMRATDKTGEISLIRRILQQINNSTEINYRALIYACQKTEDFLNKVGELNLNLEFVENLFIGTVMYSFKIHNGNRKEWKDISFTSAEFGSYAYPLYKIMFDFINFQAFRLQDVKYMEEIFLKTKNISDADSVLERIYVYYKIPEKEVKEALVEVENYLTRDSGIVHNEYVKIANYLIAIKHHLELRKEVDACISKMLENTKKAVNSGEEVQVYLSSGVQLLSEEEIKEFNKFKQDMQKIVKSKRDELDFDYNPESLYSFYDKIVMGKRSFINEGGFANKLDVNRVLEMLSNCLPNQIEQFRGILQYIYMGISNISEFLSEDAINLQKIKIGVDELIKDKKKFDKTQVLQFSWLSKNLDGIINKLKGGKNGI